MKKMKFIKIGWIGRTDGPNNLISVDDSCGYSEIKIFMWGSRGTKKHWDIDNWPPRKVRVTVEEI